MKKPSYMLKLIFVMIVAGLYGGGIFYLGLVLGEKRTGCELILNDGHIGGVIDPAATLKIYTEGCLGLNRTADCKLVYPHDLILFGLDE